MWARTLGHVAGQQERKFVHHGAGFKTIFSLNYVIKHADYTMNTGSRVHGQIVNLLMNKHSDWVSPTT